MIYISNKKLPNRVWHRIPDLFDNFEFKEVTNVHMNKFLYCGRPSILGNPFSHLNDSIARFKCKQEEVIPNYEKWLNELNENSKEIKLLQKLKEYGLTKNLCLECWCKPKPCHLECIVRKIEKI